MSDVFLPDTVRHYLARAGHNRLIRWDEKVKGFCYPVRSSYVGEDTSKDVDGCASLLPLIVPGLEVITSALARGHGSVWFTWSRSRMWQRYRDLYEEYGVADERLAYQTCRGKVTPRGGQQRLPGVAEIEPYSTRDAGFFASWTPHALRLMDGGFCHRLCYPNTGGPDAVPFGEQRVVVGDEWWLVGTRGDSADTLAHEIECSPLSQVTKENLLDNLKHVDFSEPPQFLGAVP